jgi:trk system potassium uptake protein
LSGLDHLPVSVNIWRCFLQLIGGLGIMLLVVAVLPMLGLGGMQLYKAETPGPMKDTKFTPRIAETARGLWGVYFLFSGACLLGYRWAGMSWADAFMHMCTTMGLGGFSSYDASLGHFDSAKVEWVAMVFMALSGISFVRYFVVLRSRNLRPITHDREIRTYAGVLLAATLLLALLLVVHGIRISRGAAPQRIPRHFAGHHHRLCDHRLCAMAHFCPGVDDVSGVPSCPAPARPEAASRWCG